MKGLFNMDFNAFLIGAALAAFTFLLFYYVGKTHRLENEIEELEEKLNYMSKVAHDLKEKLNKEKK